MIALFCTLLFAAPAYADANGDDVVSQMDAELTRASDQFFSYDITTQEPGKKPKLMSITVQVKSTKTLTEFLAPGDLKGTRVLVLSRTQMYIYVPAFRKVRRIGSHVTEQGFMGTTYSHAEMAALDYGPAYDGKLLSDNDKTWTVELTPKLDANTPYGKLEMEILKDMKHPAEIRYFNTKGQKVKTERRTDYSCDVGLCNAATMRMTDHTRNETWTEFKRTDWKPNNGYGDDLFSVRRLQRGD